MSNTKKPKKFSVGSKVGWNSEAGHVSGSIKKIHTKPFKLYGKDGTAYTRHASKANPVYEIKSNISDHLAYHYARALHKAENGIALTPEEQYQGLNNSSYNQMFFPMKGNNTFRGLDNGQPVQLVDETGNTKILYGPNDQTIMKGQVMENKVKAKSGISIKPSHKGRFTAYKKRTGKTTEEALHSKDPHVRKMAQFALNASHWNHGNDGLDIQPIGYAAALASGIDSLIPYEQYKPLNTLPLEYEDHPYGTNSSAIMQAGGQMSDSEIYQSYAKQLKGNPDAPRLANILTLAQKYHVSPSSIYTTSDHAWDPSSKNSSGLTRQITYNVIQEGKAPMQFVQPIGGDYVGAYPLGTPNTTKPAIQEVASAFVSGGGLSREADYGSKKKPYPSVPSDKFMGPHRSYPVENIHDAVDALRLAGMHHQHSIMKKIYAKYPQLAHGASGENGIEMPGNTISPLEFLGQGGAKTISNNPYSISPTIQFVGPSHAEGGIPVQYGNNPAEVEGDETGFVDNSGDMQIMGNMKVPGMNMKFKNVMKGISKKENKANSFLSRAEDIEDTNNTNHTEFGDAATNSAKLMQYGASLQLKKLNSKKEQLVHVQNQMLDMAHSLGIDPQEMSYGKIKKAKPTKKAKNGATLKFQVGGRLNPIFSYTPGVQYSNDTTTSTNPYGSLREAWKATNPGNIKYSKWSASLGAIQGPPATDGGYFAIFPSKEAGYNAISTLLSQPSYGNLTVSDAIKRYTGGAPYGRGLISDDIKGLKMSQLSPEQKESLISGIIKGEGNAYDSTGHIRPMPTPPEMNIKMPSPGELYTPVPSLNIKMPTSKQMYGTPTPIIDEGLRPESPSTPYSNAPTAKTAGTPTKPAGLSPEQIIPELFALGQNKVQGVQGESYTPRLYQPYQISLQDQINQNEADFRGLEHTVGNNPEALSTLAARKYGANSSILGNEFRTNQQINNQISNNNIQLLNKANLTNLQLGDQQYVRQQQAIANTQAQNNNILQSISNKYNQNRLENAELQAYQNMYPNFRMEDTNGDGIPDTEKNIKRGYVYGSGGKILKKKKFGVPNSVVVKALK